MKAVAEHITKQIRKFIKADKWTTIEYDEAKAEEDEGTTTNRSASSETTVISFVSLVPSVGSAFSQPISKQTPVSTSTNQLPVKEQDDDVEQVTENPSVLKNVENDGKAKFSAGEETEDSGSESRTVVLVHRNPESVSSRIKPRIYDDRIAIEASTDETDSFFIVKNLIQELVDSIVHLEEVCQLDESDMKGNGLLTSDVKYLECDEDDSDDLELDMEVAMATSKGRPERPRFAPIAIKQEPKSSSPSGITGTNITVCEEMKHEPTRSSDKRSDDCGPTKICETLEGQKKHSPSRPKLYPNEGKKVDSVSDTYANIYAQCGPVAGETFPSLRTLNDPPKSFRRSMSKQKSTVTLPHTKTHVSQCMEAGFSDQIHEIPLPNTPEEQRIPKCYGDDGSLNLPYKMHREEWYGPHRVITSPLSIPSKKSKLDTFKSNSFPTSDLEQLQEKLTKEASVRSVSADYLFDESLLASVQIKESNKLCRKLNDEPDKKKRVIPEQGTILVSSSVIDVVLAVCRIAEFFSGLCDLMIPNEDLDRGDLNADDLNDLHHQYRETRKDVFKELLKVRMSHRGSVPGEPKSTPV